MAVCSSARAAGIRTAERGCRRRLLRRWRSARCPPPAVPPMPMGTGPSALASPQTAASSSFCALSFSSSLTGLRNHSLLIR